MLAFCLTKLVPRMTTRMKKSADLETEAASRGPVARRLAAGCSFVPSRPIVDLRPFLGPPNPGNLRQSRLKIAAFFVRERKLVNGGVIADRFEIFAVNRPLTFGQLSVKYGTLDFGAYSSVG